MAVLATVPYTLWLARREWREVAAAAAGNAKVIAILPT
jgi:hypothetical protein